MNLAPQAERAVPLLETARHTLLAVRAPLALLLLVPAFAFAGDPALIPNSYDRPLFDTPPVFSVPFTPSFMSQPLIARPLSLGPAGQFATLSLGGTQSESSVASSGLLVVTANNDFRGFGVGIARSIDGGATLTDAGLLPLPAGYSSHGDPWLAVWNPPAGSPIFYCSCLVTTPSGFNEIALYRSTDGGATWAGPFVITPSGSGGNPDRGSIAVDPETGRVLLAWTLFALSSVSIRVTYSDDAAIGNPPTWAPALTVGSRGVDGQATTLVANPVNSEVYLAWLTFPGGLSRDIAFTRSLDNGATWATPMDIGPEFNAALCAYGFDRWLWSFSGNSIARNPVDGGLEMVYSASVSGTPDMDFGDIIYRRSLDDGKTWSAPVAINAFPGTDRPQVLPSVSATSDGRVDVIWYDQSAGSGFSDLTDLFYCFSNDFGHTWSSPVPLTSEPFHCESGNNFGAPQQGDYNDVDGTRPDGIAFASSAIFTPPGPVTSGGDPFVFTAVGMQVAPLRVRPGSIVVVDHGCGTNDGVLVAGEAGDLTIPLENIGRGTLTGVAAVLTALTPGVDVQPGARTYGAIAPGASGTSTDVYHIGLPSSYSCGTPCRFRLDVSADGVTPNFVEFSLPTGVIASASVLLDENFDGVVAPALPPGWTATTVRGTPAPWHTTTDSPASPPNAAFGPEPGTNNFERLASPLLELKLGTDYVEITFDSRYSLFETSANYAPDAVSLDYLIQGIPITHFASGDASEMSPRYNHNVWRSSGSSGDRWGWSGAHLSYEPVRVVIPVTGLFGNFTLFWDMTTQGIPGGVGAWVDNVKVRAITLGCGGCNPTVAMLARFEARAAGEEVELVWASEAISQISAWVVYRGLSLEGPFQRLNTAPIPMGAGGEFRLVDTPEPGGRIYYRLAALDPEGGEHLLETIPYDVTAAMRALAFQVAGPNPFQEGTTLRYSLAGRCQVRLELFDVAGQRLRTLVDGWADAGTYTTNVDSDGARALKPGVYLVRLTAGSQRRTLRLVAFK